VKTHQTLEIKGKTVLVPRTLVWANGRWFDYVSNRSYTSDELLNEFCNDNE
jgi:hypothetical protein